MDKNYSFRFPRDLSDLVEAEAERRQITASQVIREAVAEHFNPENIHQTLVSLQDDVRELVYETLKTRAVVIRSHVSTVDEAQRLVAEAEHDATQAIAKKNQ